MDFEKELEKVKQEFEQKVNDLKKKYNEQQELQDGLDGIATYNMMVREG